MPEPITAIVLAGGQGTRLRSVVPDLPKPMASVAGRPFLEILLNYWIAQGVSRFILSVGYRREAIMDHFGTAYRGIPIAYAIEEQPLGTGGGLLIAIRQLLDDTKNVLLLNGDTFFAVALNELIAYAENQHSAWCLALFPTSHTERYMGVERDAQGRLQGLGRKADGGTVLANGGVYWLATKNLAQLGLETGQEYSLEADILPKALAAAQRIVGMPAEGTFIDIGIPDDYQRAQTLLSKAASANEFN